MKQAYSPAKHLLAAILLLFITMKAAAAGHTVTISGAINVSCSGGSDGSATANVSGGVGPFTYSWSPAGGTNATATGLFANTYTCVVTDQSDMSTAWATVTITQPAPLAATVSTTSSTCGNPNGMASLSVTGGTPAYTFAWLPSISNTAYLTNVTAGTYTYTVTDSHNCSITATVTIGNLPGPVVSVSHTDCSCFGSCDGSTSSTVTGNGPFTYLWNNGPWTPNMSGLCAGVFSVTVTDQNGCVGTGSVTITEPPQLVATPGAIIPAGCNMNNGSADVIATGGSGIYAYLWTPGNQNTQLATMIGAGTYMAHVTDNHGCVDSVSVTVGDSCDYVWPGDANDDGVADNTDILDIGIANGATGTPRANASLAWIGQPSAPWGQTLLSGTDYKWVDCDGSGAIDPQDTNAVVQNFGLTHNNRLAANPPYNASLPDLTVTMGQGVLGAGSPGTLTISLGSSSLPASNVYGVAFTLNFDPAQIDVSSFRLNQNGSWMGTPGNDLMGVVLRPAAGGSVQVALTRIDHNDVSGFGNIANMGFVTTSALYGSGNMQNVNFTISNVTVISGNETPQQVNTVGDSTLVSDPLILGVASPGDAGTLSAYPNPFSESVQVTLPEPCRGKSCELVLTDAAGRVVMRQQTGGSPTAVLQRGMLEAGVYFLAVRSGDQWLGRTRLVVR